MKRNSCLAMLLATAAGVCTSVNADVVAFFDFDFNVASTGRNISYTTVPDNTLNNGAFPGTAASTFPDLFGDCDRSRSRNVADDTLVIFPNDNFGIMKNARFDRAFATNDVQNTDNPTGAGTASWSFNISGYTGLSVSVDLAAMGDFEATGNAASTADSWSMTASIDGGAPVTLFSSVVREDIDGQAYSLERFGRVINTNDPLEVNGTVLTNSFGRFSFPVAGSGSVMTLTLNVTSDGNDETFMLDNIVIEGNNGSPDPLGACCLTAGVCVQATSSSCFGLGASNWVFGGACDADCASPVGACCVPNGACGQTTGTDCSIAGGLWDGPGTNCGSTMCPFIATGGCCATDGTCSIASAADCATSGGAYSGDFTDCTGACPQPGACCLVDGSCAITLAGGCTSQGGEFQGEMTACETAQCVGACCLLGGGCSQLTQTACTNGGGTYAGDGITCEAANCSAPTGACCFADTTCRQLTSADCATQGGSFRGEGTTCGTANCGSPLGSVEITRFDFDANSVGGRNLAFTQVPAAGTFASLGDGFQPFQLCANDCPSHAMCSAPFTLVDDSISCFPTDRLGIMPETRLDRWFGVNDITNPSNLSGICTASWTFNISGYTDVSLSIVMGAMGDYEATGTVASPADSYQWTVAIDGGAPVTVFSSVVREDLTQAYTMANGTTIVTLDDPLQMNGVILTNTLRSMKTGALGSGSTLTLTLNCTNDGDEGYAFDDIIVRGISTAPQTGRCCFPNGSCDILTEANCTSGGGAYGGNGTDCTVPCPQPTGACCQVDGSCSEVTAAACGMISGGVYQGDGTNCESTACPQPTGACCMDRCSCNVMTEADCADAGGIYLGDESACSEIACLPNTECPCDWNGFDGLDSQDFFDFLDGFFTGNADFNCVDGTDSQDYFDFVNCFFLPPEGC